MKRLIADIHMHTLASGHAYGTIREMAAAAKEQQLQLIGISEHAPGIPGTVDPFYYGNLRVIPRVIDGVEILHGCEINVLNGGRLSLEQKYIDRLDYAIVGIHGLCYQNEGTDGNTTNLIECMKNPKVKLVSHPDDDHTPLDYPRLVQAALQYHVALEVNNSSLVKKDQRLNCYQNYRTMLALCQQYRVPIVVDSDAHDPSWVGRQDLAANGKGRAGLDKQEQQGICREIGARTGGDIYIGVVGPVRSGKSTFIKRFMEQLVLPAMGTEAARLRARDELPQSAAGRTIMTTEPKFIPETAVPLQLEGGGVCRVRLIDCVGYMVEGAMGHEENEKPRMVKSPWFDEEVPFDLAAETGTRRVIREHSTIGIVITTDGTVSDIPRAGYAKTEKRVIEELDALGKPYVILLNSTRPDAPETKQLAEGMARDYHHAVLPVSCVDLDAAALGDILRQVLYEFPVRELDLALPRWVNRLENGHWLQAQVYTAAMQLAENIARMKDVPSGTDGPLLDCDAVQRSAVSGMDLAQGSVRVVVELKPEIFYQVLSEQTGLEIGDEAGLMPCILELAHAKREYEKVRKPPATAS